VSTGPETTPARAVGEEDKKVINREVPGKWSPEAMTRTRKAWRDENSALARERDLALQRQRVAQGKWLRDAKMRARNVWRDQNIELARKRDRTVALRREQDLALQRLIAKDSFLEDLKERTP
jgi:hypothetical protein